MSEFFNCSYCDCVFCSESDLASHLRVFGCKAVLHRRNFNHVHFDVEMTYSRDHGGADRSVARVCRLISSYLEMCKASGKKVRALI